jgi:hypothetical protein
MPRLDCVGLFRLIHDMWIPDETNTLMMSSRKSEKCKPYHPACSSR